jgi:hypothetical protein
MRIHTEGNIKESEDLEIQFGIFQGDSLSSLIFCISLSPLTKELNKLNTGHEEHTKQNQKYNIYFTWMI